MDSPALKMQATCPDIQPSTPFSKAGLWSRYSNFRLQLQLRPSNFLAPAQVPTSWDVWLRLQNNLVQKTEKHCIICITHLNRNPNFRLRLHPSKITWDSSSTALLIRSLTHINFMGLPWIDFGTLVQRSKRSMGCYSCGHLCSVSLQR